MTTTPYLEDRATNFVLHAPHTPRFQSVSYEVGGRRIDRGYLFPRTMMAYDGLHARIRNLNTLPFPNARGFALRDMGQDAHPKWSMLRAYQQETVDILVSTPHPGVLVELSPGLGKSPVSSIAADVLGLNNVLIIAVKSLRRTWQREIATWTGRDAVLRFHEPPTDGWNVTNFDTIVEYYKAATSPAGRAGKVRNPYADKKWDLVIVDESVLIKNRRAMRTKATQALRARAKRVWLLTGSPTARYADDLWTQLNLVYPQAFSSYWRFARQFCVLEETPWGVNVIGTREDADFVWELRDVMVSYNQKDVLDLPPLLRESIDLDLTPGQRAAYDSLMSSFVAELSSGVRVAAPNRMARLIRLQQVISNLKNLEDKDDSCKADALVDLVTTDYVRFPLLVWVHWLPGAHALYERLRVLKKGKEVVRVALVVGGDAQAEETIDAYKRSEYDILVLSMGVGKFGHTLTNTNSVVYVDRTFDGDAFYQSFHRVERFGLDHPVQVVVLRCPGTIEEFNVEENLAGKMETVAHITEADLAKLLTSLGGKR
jgi:hypothetical protein